ENRLWLMVHSGSRGMGQAITSHHVSKMRERPRHGKLLSLDAESPDGRAYLADVAWAIGYAEQNRIAIIVAVEQLLADLFGIVAKRVSLIHSNHNHVRRETHDGQVYWVHRKGALSAADGEFGVIP